jgi:mannose-6-phosphate isomerase-like protein (cupin superfamily)
MTEKTIVKDLEDKPDQTWTFLDGSKRNTIILSSVAIGKGIYLPGWTWSKHTGKIAGKESEAHIGYIISGKMMVMDAEGNKVEIGQGEAFEVQPGHDAWVIGKEPCVALDFSSLTK